MTMDSQMALNVMDPELSARVLEQIPTPIMAMDKELKVIFMNAAGRELLGMPWEDIEGVPCYGLLQSLHCNTPECCMRQAMDKSKSFMARNEMNIHGRKIPVEYSATPLRDASGEIAGGLVYVIDITERVRAEKKMREQSRTIQEISTPAISLWEGIVVLPVVGVVDTMRAKQMMGAMLAKIKETSAKIIILDIQGVASIDTAVATHLIKIGKATKLMGCRCIISGISPVVAEAIVQLGIDLGDVSTNSTLKDALSDAFAQLNYDVKKTR